MHGRFARYRYTGDVHEIARKAEDGMLPIFQSTPGFKAYSVMTGDGEILSFSAWDSAESAEAANAAAAEFVATTLADQLELEETRVGEIMLSTTLGVSAKAGAGV
jgi:hypothetical protein